MNYPVLKKRCGRELTSKLKILEIVVLVYWQQGGDLWSLDSWDFTKMIYLKKYFSKDNLVAIKTQC